MSVSADCDTVLRSHLTNLGLSDSGDLASFCSKPNFTVNSRTFKILLNVSIILNFQEKYDLAFRIVKILFTKHTMSESTLGTSITVALLLVEVALNCHYRERSDEEYLHCVGDAFKLLDKAYELLSGNVKDKATLLTKPVNAEGKGVDFCETACVILLCHTAFYKSKVCFALRDHLTAKQIINNSLEIIWKYLQFIMSDSPSIWVEASPVSDKKQQQQQLVSLTDYLTIPEADGVVKSRVQLSPESVAVISSKVCHICRMGTSLNARAEYVSGNFPGAKAICAQLRILESLPNTIEDRRIALDNNEACISLQLREIHSSSAQISRCVQDICSHFRALSVPRYLPQHRPATNGNNGSNGSGSIGEEGKPLSVLADASIVGCLYNTGLVLLKLSRPLEAFVYFDKVAGLSTITSTLADQPYVWIRLAECCIQQEAINSAASSAASASSDSSALQVQSISKGRSRRLQIISSSPKAGSALAAAIATEDSEAAKRCTLSAAVVYLKKALEVCQRLRQSLKKPTGKATLMSIQDQSHSRVEGELNSFREKEVQRLLHLENTALLRLTHIYLRNQDPCSALEYAQRLVDQAPNDELSQFRYLGYNYYVEVLCLLGKQDKAASFLKTQFDVSYPDTVIASVYLSPELFRGTCATPGKLYQSQFKLPPNIAAMALQVNKAVVLIVRGQYSAAATILEAILRMCPAFMPAIRCLIYVYIRQGKMKQALNVLNIAQKAKI